MLFEILRTQISIYYIERLRENAGESCKRKHGDTKSEVEENKRGGEAIERERVQLR